MGVCATGVPLPLLSLLGFQLFEGFFGVCRFSLSAPSAWWPHGSLAQLFGAVSCRPQGSSCWPSFGCSLFSSPAVALSCGLWPCAWVLGLALSPPPLPSATYAWPGPVMPLPRVLLVWLGQWPGAPPLSSTGPRRKVCSPPSSLFL